MNTAVINGYIAYHVHLAFGIYAEQLDSPMLYMMTASVPIFQYLPGSCSSASKTSTGNTDNCSSSVKRKLMTHCL